MQAALISTAPQDHSKQMPNSPLLIPSDSSRARRRSTSHNSVLAPFHSRAQGRATQDAHARIFASGGGSGLETDALRTLERAASLALDEAMTSLSDLRLLLHSHLNMSHIRWLQGKEDLALAHLHEARDLFVGLLVTPTGRCVLSDGPAGFCTSLLALLNRMVGLMVGIGADELKSNTFLLDTMVQLETDIAAQLQLARAAGSPASDTGRRVWALLQCMRLATTQNGPQRSTFLPPGPARHLSAHSPS